MSIQLEQQQTQLLKLSSEMKQSLAMLQMPILELREWLHKQAEENPFLECDEGDHELEPQTVKLAKKPLQPVVLSDNVALTLAGIEAATSYTSENLAAWDEYPTDPWDKVSAKVTLTEYLLEQLGELALSKRLFTISRYLIQDLDHRGYLPDNSEELVQEIGCSYEELRQAVQLVQGLQPAGVGASDLSECLLLQLQGKKETDSVLCSLVKNDLEELGRKNYVFLRKKYKISREKLEQLEAKIKLLNPHPSRGFAGTEEILYVVPEARLDENFQVVFNNNQLPGVYYNKTYLKLMQQSCDPKTQAYLKEYFHKAGLIMTGLKDREKTINRIIKCIVKKQEAYFKKGIRFLQPMTLKDLGEELQLHESTVSRAVKDKYILCSYGTISLKSLFSNKIDRGAGQQVSAAAVKNQLKALINSEDKSSPYTDRELSELLGQGEMPVSRRTVAKYREELGQLPASRRKSRNV